MGILTVENGQFLMDGKPHRIISWEFPGFSVDTHLEGLLRAWQILEEQGSIAGTIHRFLLVAQRT